MGRKKKTTNESPEKATNYLKTLDNKKKVGIRSVQEMDDSTYMYMLIVGQLMFDRRHLIAEKLAEDLSLSALALASSDALLRIIGKSREVQHSVVSNCESSSNLKHKSTDNKRVAASLRKENSHCNSDIKPAVEIDLAEEDHAKSPDGVIVEYYDNESTEETSDTFPEESLKKKIEENNTSPTKKDTLPPDFSSDPNIPRETADGKIIMVYVPQEKFPCPRPNCKQNFLTKENLDYHLVCSRIHNAQFVKDWGCRYCGKEFSGMSHVKQHEKMKHEEHDKEVCYECGKQFDSLEKMKRHIDVHHLQKKYKCKDPSCQMEFSSESGAKYHYKRVHLNDQIPCTIAGCARKFDRNCDLRRHLEKAHRDGQLAVPSARAVPKQLQQQLQPQHQQETQQVLPVVEHTPDQQQPLLPSQYPQEETTYTTMQTVSQQMTMPGTVMPGTTLDPQQQLNQEQLQAIQSLQYLQQHQQQPQPHPPGPSQQQFPSAPSSYHSGYMY